MHVQPVTRSSYGRQQSCLLLVMSKFCLTPLRMQQRINSWLFSRQSFPISKLLLFLVEGETLDIAK